MIFTKNNEQDEELKEIIDYIEEFEIDYNIWDSMKYSSYFESYDEYTCECCNKDIEEGDSVYEYKHPKCVGSFGVWSVLCEDCGDKLNSIFEE